MEYRTPPTLDDALEDCRTTLERSLAQLREDVPRQITLEHVRPNLASLASIAARTKVPPERVIVMLKRMLRELPALVRWRETERENVSHELVTMTIAAYYETDGHDGNHGE